MIYVFKVQLMETHTISISAADEKRAIKKMAALQIIDPPTYVLEYGNQEPLSSISQTQKSEIDYRIIKRGKLAPLEDLRND